ncbi:hypothetical protein RJI07_05765 [Mycoplasmatota bacterium WC30]
MNKRQYRTTLIAFGVIAIGFIIANATKIIDINWLWIFIIISAGYIYIRYKISAPLQTFSTRFNMLVDYDLDVEGALKLAQENVDNAPNETVKSLFMIYLGMAYYYNSKYREAINTFNQINLAKVNHLYHVLIFAFTAYSAYEEEDLDTFNLAINRMDEVKNRVQKKYLGFAASYLEILKAIKNLEIDPEAYRDVIERNFSREDGYLSTKLVYNYRMAHYYETVGNVEEMDKCLAKVIANGKTHHTAVRAEEMFKNTCNIDDFVFPDPAIKVEDAGDVEVIEDPLQIESLDEVEVVEEKEENIE